MLKELRGQVERVTYNNEENSYTVAKVKVRGGTRSYCGYR